MRGTIAPFDEFGHAQNPLTSTTHPRELQVVVPILILEPWNLIEKFMQLVVWMESEVNPDKCQERMGENLPDKICLTLLSISTSRAGIVGSSLMAFSTSLSSAEA